MEPNHRRGRRKDHVGHYNGEVSLRITDDELDPWTAWAYKPRTISLLFIGACFLIWASGALDPESSSSADLVTSVKRGIWAMMAVFLTYCLLQAPSTLLIRPHPAIWRLVHGMAVIYLVALTFLLFQNRDDARQLMKYLHPDLGVELPERSYGTDCRIYVPENPTSRFINVYETLFDEFVPAHIFGWWGKAIMIRNQPLLWVLSIGFELMELTFRHMLPNFNECWWDSIILDILICNWFGIWAGMHTVRYFDAKTYEWVGISRQPNILSKVRLSFHTFELKSLVKRTLGQFTPAHWDKDEWHPLLGPWRFIQVLSLCIVFLTVELNTFFLKFCLWVPPRNPIIVYRLVLWWLIAIPTIREYNSYLQDRKPVKKVGAFCWLSLAICIIELFICIKFGHGEFYLLHCDAKSFVICAPTPHSCSCLFPTPMPRWLVVLWTIAGVVLSGFLILWTRQSRRRTISRKRV
ncbi:Phosphatidyl serine synthase [Cynara cardunculus var. scolymus]|uniref:CDP-diacylglycerol--serine O-phosphatidyltransferase n=1 Tax=Cynara cardunculus var. scolymus TaxID=59895 RepID=A0A103YA82_CYNCS|nr:Phosphatidyl serine synthase [Cynara cardunculus var. scolymus]